MLTVAFEAFVIALIVAVASAIARFLPPRYRLGALAALAAWTLLASALGLSGAFSNAALRPPGFVYLFVPTLLTVAFVSRSRAGALVATSLPLWLLLGAQSVRFVVELFLDRLYHAGTLPALLTFGGGNVDIAIGASAPVLAILAATRRLDARAALVWNGLGLASLANVVVRGVLTSPAVHALASGVPNAIGFFPFTFVPALIVPFALVTHVLSVRALRASQRGGNPAFGRRPASDFAAVLTQTVR
jgi:hypothetical protein